MPTIWFCPTCRVGVRVPNNAGTSRMRYRCPRCRATISIVDSSGDSSPEVVTELEAIEEDLPEVEPVELPSPRRDRPSRRPRPKRRPSGTPVWVAITIAGVGLVALLAVVIGLVIVSRPSATPAPPPKRAPVSPTPAPEEPPPIEIIPAPPDPPEDLSDQPGRESE